MTLTTKQQRVLDAIRFLIGKDESPTVREIGALVGLKSTSTVQKHLDSLEDAGVIERRGRLSRGIRLARPDAPVLAVSRSSGGIPLVGRIAAGQPLDMIEDAEMVGSDGDDNSGNFPAGFVEVGIDASLFVSGADGSDLVALRVAGESMVKCGILDGDIVIIRRQSTVEEGEVAAVSVDGAGTLKRWHRAGPLPRGSSTRDSSTRDSSRATQSAWSDSVPSESAVGDSRTVELHPANERFPVLEIREEDGQDVRVFGKYVGLIRGAQI